MKFYIAAVKTLCLKSNILQTLSFLNPGKSQTMHQSTLDLIEERIVFDKAAVKLKHGELMLDGEVEPKKNEDAIAFWLKVSHLKSPMGEKYLNFATLTLQLLSIPSSNADSEALVRRIKTDFRSSQTDTLSALIGCHFNKTTDCCKKVNFDESLITKANLHS